jgi:hypothetical protein
MTMPVINNSSFEAGCLLLRSAPDTLGPTCSHHLRADGKHGTRFLGQVFENSISASTHPKPLKLDVVKPEDHTL